MAALVIDRRILPEPLFSFVGADADRVMVTKERGGVFLAPADAAEPDEGLDGGAYIDGPDSRYIDPADYPDTTAYLNALPGVAERLLAYRNLPDSEFKPVPRKFVDV